MILEVKSVWHRYIGRIHSFICATHIYHLLDSEAYRRSENMLVSYNSVSYPLEASCPIEKTENWKMDIEYCDETG